MSHNIKPETQFPKAKTKELLLEDLGGELLVFDINKNRAHCLNGSAAAIWRRCDGTRSVAMLAADLFPELPVSDAQRLVSIGLERLGKRQLMETPSIESSYRGASSRNASVDLSKRHLMKKMAIVAAAAGIAAPIISTVVAPTSAYAVSCGAHNAICAIDANCCSGLCIAMHCA